MSTGAVLNARNLISSLEPSVQSRNPTAPCWPLPQKAPALDTAGDKQALRRKLGRQLHRAGTNLHAPSIPAFPSAIVSTSFVNLQIILVHELTVPKYICPNQSDGPAAEAIMKCNGYEAVDTEVILESDDLKTTHSSDTKDHLRLWLVSITGSLNFNGPSSPQDVEKELDIVRSLLYGGQLTKSWACLGSVGRHAEIVNCKLFQLG